MFKLASLPRTIEAALRDVEHESARVRRSAVRDLARFAAPPERRRAVVALERALTDKDPEVRADVVVAFCDLGERGVVPHLLRLLGDAQLRVRQMAVLGLGELAAPTDGEVVGRIGSFLSAGEPALRFQALSAWANLVPERLAEAVVERARDADAEVRALSMRLIEEHFVEAARELPSEIERAVRERLSDASPGVSLLAAIVLGRAGLPTDTELLRRAVGERTGLCEPADEQVAIELCGTLGVRAAVPALRRRAFGLFGWTRDPFLWQARVALAKLGDERARRSILEALGSRFWHVRAVAVDAAGKARLTAARPRLEELLSDPALDREQVETALSTLAQVSDPSAGARGDG